MNVLVVVAHGSLKSCSFGMKRLISATIYWYIARDLLMGSIFQYFGTCSDSQFTTYHACTTDESSKWLGFDSSGHVFIVIHSSLYLIEEMNSLLIPIRQTVGLQKQETTLGLFAEINGLIIGFVLCLWYLMLFITCLYFHPLLELIAGYVFGILFWLAIYVVVKAKNASAIKAFFFQNVVTDVEKLR